VIPALLLASIPLARAWRNAEGTALKAAVVWAFIALVLGLAAECLAAVEPPGGGRPAAGHIAYLCCLAALAGLISVLNARTPGGGAWAILMALLVVVFLIPWLEGPGLGRGAGGLTRLRLDNPWTIFYVLLVVAGVTNYLPTRYGPAAAWLALGFVLEYLGLTRTVASRLGLATVWSAVPWTFAAAAAAAELCARRSPAGRSEADAVWLWFRDHWGVVWALRVMERFNRSAETLGWPVRLTWQGLVGTKRTADVEPPAEAAAVLIGLLRRFATADTLARVATRGAVTPCHRVDGPR